MPGAPDPLYVRARVALLDALDALAAHLDALVLVGAQAIYLHTGNADLLVAEYTTDADLSVSPGELADRPLLGDLLAARGFSPQRDPGSWLSPSGVIIDLMVPDLVAGPGRRGARLGAHGNRAARRAKGLEGALVDRQRMTITTLDAGDRSADLWVAGPGALLVAKTHKIVERRGSRGRARDKDALDVLRLLRAVDTQTLTERLTMLRSSPLAGPVTEEAVEHLPGLFGDAESEGVRMAVHAAGDAEDPTTIAASLVALIQDLRDALATDQTTPPG